MKEVDKRAEPTAEEIKIAIAEIEGQRLSHGGHSIRGGNGWLARVKTIFDVLGTIGGD